MTDAVSPARFAALEQRLDSFMDAVKREQDMQEKMDNRLIVALELGASRHDRMRTRFDEHKAVVDGSITRVHARVDKMVYYLLGAAGSGIATFVGTMYWVVEKFNSSMVIFAEAVRAGGS
jgi:hypothetical protein